MTVSTVAMRQGPRPAHRIWNLGLFAGAIFLALFGIGLLVTKAYAGHDAHAYWAAWQGGIYSRPQVLGLDAYLYSPAFAQVIWPLTLLPFPVFRALDSLGAAATFLWLLWPLPWRLRLPMLVACSAAIAMGNMQWAVLLTAVAGLRLPGLWAIPLLTKVTPGIGVVWFAARREWRALAIALGTTAAIVLVSFLLAPGLWGSWIEVLRENASQHSAGTFAPGFLPDLSLGVRVGLAALLVAWGGWRDHRWTLAAAVTLAQPDAGIDTVILLLAALPRLLGADAASGRDRGRAASPMLSSGP